MYSQHDVVELVSMLVGAPTIEEQADILHYLVLCYGPRYKILAAQVRVIHILRNQLYLFFVWGLESENGNVYLQNRLPCSVLWPQIRGFTKFGIKVHIVKAKEPTETYI